MAGAGGLTAAQDAAGTVLASFGDLSERYRRELHLHCYRMLASFDDAEDAVQEAPLRAWRARESFDGSTLFRVALPDRHERLPGRAQAACAAPGRGRFDG